MASLPKNSRANCYFGCKEGGPLHCFPRPDKDINRFNLWKEVLEDKHKEKSDKYIYNQIRLCNKHFEWYFILNKKLTGNAVPTLCIKGADANSTSVLHIDPMPSTSATQQCNAAIANDDIALKKSLQQNMLLGRTKENSHEAIIKNLKQRVLEVQKKYKNSKIKAARKLIENKKFMNTINSMPLEMKTLINMQLQYKKKPKGRKFTLQEKIIAASIYKQSQKGYLFLRKMLILPSKRTIQRLLSTFKLEAGINENILKHLKKTVQHQSIEKRLYTLLFDEVALSPGVYFDQKDIIGFEDRGSTRTTGIADHALVMMIKGIKSKKKQPIMFTFCKNSTKKFELKQLIRETIEKLEKVGIIIVATICDQAASNVGAIKLLQNETKEKYLREGRDYVSNAFEVGNLKIFPLFDTPHLLKGVRNNFIKKNIKFTQDGKTKNAKWEHLRLLLNEDKGEDEIRIVNKLTEYHVDQNKLPKMKVKYAAQVFSQRVSAVMRFLARRKILPPECEDTADLLGIFDKLFDSFNGHSYRDAAKVLKGCFKNNSAHLQFWDEVLPILKSIEFETYIKNSDGTLTIKYEKVPSIQNWIHNIHTFREMWKHLNQNFKINNLITRSFNQDPLENFFCCIRSHGVRNIHPTCMQFISAYKTLLINNMNSIHSIGANCEIDDFQPLQSMTFLFSETSDSSDQPDFACEIDSLITTMNEIVSGDCLIHEEAKKYVAGYIIKKSKTNIFKNCKNCMSDLKKSETYVDSFNYAMDYTKKSLFNACDDFVKLLNEIYFVIVTCLRDSPQIRHLKDKIFFFINCRCDFSLIKCEKHRSALIDYIINLSIKLIVNSWCTGVNRILNGKIVDFDVNDRVKLQAFNYNKTHRKRK